MKKRFLFFIPFFVLCVLAYQFFFRVEADHHHPKRGLPTFYEYSASNLGAINSTFLISEESLQKWHEPLNEYFLEHKVGYHTQLHFFTYLNLAQKDAAFLSYNARQCFLGSLDPLTEKIVRAIFPDFNVYPAIEKDEYSEKLAEIVAAPYLVRLEKEKNNPHQWPQNCPSTAYSNESRESATWIPFIKQLPSIPPPPDKKASEEQLKLLQKAREHLTKEQIQLAKAWAGRGEKHIVWWDLANAYMVKNNVHLAKQLLARALLMMGLYDAVIGTMEWKYTFCVPRPAIIDPALKPLFGNVYAPTYPSGHGVEAGSAQFILSSYFPEDTLYWKRMAEESEQSRIWGGVHYPIDLEVGHQLGLEIGEQIIEIYGRI